MTEKTPTLNRRDFLKIAGVGVTVLAGTRIVRDIQASGPTEKGPHQWAMVIDQSKCTGCGYCTKTCQANNDIAPEIQWNKVIRVDE